VILCLLGMAAFASMLGDDGHRNQAVEIAADLLAGQSRPPPAGPHTC
jgi:hypothetical protein